MLAIENIIALNLIISKLVSPGLSVIIYLHKFKETSISKIKIVKYKGNWFLYFLNKINVNPKHKDKITIPSISDNPAIA